MLSNFQSVAVPLIYAILLFMTLAIVAGMAFPKRVLAVAQRALSTKQGLLGAAFMRFVFGLSIFIAASVARYPATFQVLGVVLVISAFAVLLLGTDRIQRLLSWFDKQGNMLMRGWLLLGALFIGFLLFALT